MIRPPEHRKVPVISLGFIQFRKRFGWAYIGGGGGGGEPYKRDNAETSHGSVDRETFLS